MTHARISLANGFPYWQGQKIENATASFFDDIAQALQIVQTVSGSTDKIEFIVGETGKYLWIAAWHSYPRTAN